MATLELTSRPGSEFCIWLSASHTSFCLGSKAWWLKLLECPRHCWIWCFSASVIHKFQFAELSQKSYIFGASFLQLPPEWTVPHPQSFLTVKCSSGSLVWDHARAITLLWALKTWQYSPFCVIEVAVAMPDPRQVMQPGLASCVSIWLQAVALSN